MRSTLLLATAAAAIALAGAAPPVAASANDPDATRHATTAHPAAPDPSDVDWSYWTRLMARESAERAKSRPKQSPVVYDEREPDGTRGANDAYANAERVRGFGSSPRKSHALRITGTLSQSVRGTVDISTAEDQGAIPIATETGIPADSSAITVSSVIGDGRDGSTGTGTGDLDFFHLEATQGQILRASTVGSPLDTLLILYDASGTIVDANDDTRTSFQSTIVYTVPADGDYYVLVTAFGENGLVVPTDPFDSSSGPGSGYEGPYRLALSAGPADTDYFAVRLRAGDVLGATAARGAEDVSVTKFNGAPRVTSIGDLSAVYPMESPLPGGGNAVLAYIAEKPGWYGVSTSVKGDGDYRIDLEVYRPGTEVSGARHIQDIFLDFNGARVNTGVFGGRGVSRLSPLTSFLANWHLTRDDLDPLIDQVVRTVNENIRRDLAQRGLNPNLTVRILNSRDDRDTFGKPNVSRVVIGGTNRQADLFTIGASESIDPGNFRHDETSLVLLDIVSDPNTARSSSFNAYLQPQSDRIAFIGTALGNIASHEIGHLMGSFHDEELNGRADLMDAGGNPQQMYGVGPDDIGGTADDADVDFGVDQFSSFGPFSGVQSSLNNTAWAFAHLP